jgi:hypothetical protein
MCSRSSVAAQEREDASSESDFIAGKFLPTLPGKSPVRGNKTNEEINDCTLQS